jgi:hypothetical protein
MTGNKTAVLGILDNYTFHQVKKFFVSLKQTGFKGDICMFVGSNTTPRTIRILRRYGVKVILFSDTGSLPPGNLAAMKYHFPQPVNYFNFRHYLYYDFLQKNKEVYSHILLTDVRDVYFQRDPFDFEQGEGLYCALEGKTKKIRECRFNGKWMEFIYGKQVLDEIGDQIISCAGTTWGTTPAILDYLERMLAEIEKLPDAHKAIDQAIHNYLIWTGQLPEVKFLNNDEGIILTLSYEHDYTIGEDDKVRAANGRVVNVLHQFDRMADLKPLSDKLFQPDTWWNLFRRRYFQGELLLHKILLRYKLRKKNQPSEHF